MTIQGEKRPKAARRKRVVMIKTLSAIGSRTFPKCVDCCQRLAKYPSKKSLADAETKTIAANQRPKSLGIKNERISKGNKIMRKDVKMFGTVKAGKSFFSCFIFFACATEPSP